MRNLFLTALAVTGLSLGLSAQHETLFNNARVIGAFGGPMWEYGISNGLGTSVGGGGAIVINSFFFGGYGLGSVDFEQLFDEGEVDVLDIGHGGLWFGGTYQPYHLVHLYGSARVGWGAINVDLNDSSLRYRDVDKIFVVTPEIGLELNLTRWFRLAGTVGYRAVSGTNDNRPYKGEDFSGLVGGITLRFGWFGNRRDY
ncbi:MAG: hypothetical protein D6772_01570 [Bacteroidetes bacterium]|nr:MAG: hypothetical protein D6772_01570 [Bacteroidota bacterium]